MSSPDATAISRPRVPNLIPGYRLERLVGKGGMGEVHRAVQLSLGRTVAVKVLGEELAKDPSFVARFEKEAAALAALSHPNVVSIVDKGRVRETYYLVMEYVDGPSLRELLRSPLLDAPKALRMVLEIARAIDYAHGRGVIHRDLKPENILFDEQAGGIPKVTDFGLAGFMDSDSSLKRFNVTETNVAMGTLAYMAPEQRLDAKTADARADLYSLGVILYELLTGEVPVGSFLPPSQRQPGVAKALDDIVARCLKPAPEDRYASVTELMAALEPLCPPIHFTNPLQHLRPVDRMVLQARVASRKVLRVVGTLLVVASVGVLVVAWLRNHFAEQKPSAGEALTAPDLLFQTARTMSTSLQERDGWRTLRLGPGEQQTQVLAQGRPVSLDGDAGTLYFGRPPGSQWVGRAQLDLVDLDSFAASFSAEVNIAPAIPNLITRAKDALLQTHFQPRTALLLVGSHKRFAALVVPMNGGQLRFEWALGDKHGTFLGPPAPPGNELKLSLRVDHEGRLTAHFGALEAPGLTMLGEPVQLGKQWKEYFGKAPSPAMGCLEAFCTFSRVRYETEHEQNPPLAALPLPQPEKPRVSAPQVHRPTATSKKAVRVVAKKPRP